MMAIRLSTVLALLLATMVAAKCKGPLPGWMPDDFPNKHRPREK